MSTDLMFTGESAVAALFKPVKHNAAAGSNLDAPALDASAHKTAASGPVSGARPMSKCHGCHQDLEPLAAVRTYHGQCDPHGRVQYLERVQRDLVQALKWFIDDIDGTHTVMLEFDANVERARAALAQAAHKEG